jgi:hypothetical protein
VEVVIDWSQPRISTEVASGSRAWISLLVSAETELDR